MGIGKRALDLVGASVVLTLASPLLVLGALAVLLGSGRPIFFGHRRLGYEGVPFRCWKLRTMRVGAEAELKPLYVLEFLEVEFPDTIPDKEFEYAPPTHLLKVPDVTDLYLGQLAQLPDKKDVKANKKAVKAGSSQVGSKPDKSAPDSDREIRNSKSPQ